ncbi:MAG: tRNA-intron lyase [Candidatus Diapherotrites archaeon]|nr:tRNA-intron lyase [Candidatus Diapherotrites archaeon]
MAEILSQNKVIVKSNKLKSQLIEKGFGEKKENGLLILDLKETLYLVEKGKIDIENCNQEKYDFEKLLKYAENRESQFYTKYVVYKDLREKGYCVKTGFKFGFHFRVYPKGKNVGEAHTQYVINVTTQDKSFTMPELSRMVRMAQTLNTELILAVVDSEDDINYYKIERATF